MNILPKKKWHVRTKENVARVRRDEAKAAVEEKARAERVTLAEHEDRLQRMKSRHRTADSTISSVADIFSSSDNVSSLEQQLEQPNSSSQSVTQHVNLFAELEQQERKNLAVGNKEYEAEKKKEKDDWESKMGIMKRFAEDTKEYSKEKEWWHNIPLRRESVETPAPLKIKPNTKPAGLEVSNKPSANTLVEKDRKRKHHHRKRKSESALPADDEKNKKSKLEKLRQERLEREHLEQKRTKELFEPKKTPTEVKSQLDQDRGRRYNSQFNPEYINKKKIN